MASDTKNFDADDDFIKIAESEDTEFMEFPKEEDGSLLLTTVQTQFPNAIGIKYKGSSGAYRAIREADNVLVAPKGGWEDIVYIVTVSGTIRKRKTSVTEDAESTPLKQPKSSVDPFEKDLAVISIPFKLKSEELKEYFENNYGETAFCEIKTDRSTGKSRGFGFVRFKDAETAKEALEGEHYIMGRRVEVKLKKEKPMKLFIGRLPNGATNEDIDKHFSPYGEIKDIFIPQPFRNFAFLTFGSTEDGRACIRENHEMNGSRLNVMERNQDKNEGPRDDHGGGNRQGYNDRRNDRYSGPSHSMSHGGGVGYAPPSFQPQQLPMQNNMADELKSMLFQLLTK